MFERLRARPKRCQTYDAIVGGGGAAGVGVAVALKDGGLKNFVVLERETAGATATQANHLFGLEQAVGLLSQQIWCWGRDIMRPEGNWLIEIGFERIEPPADRKECASIYRLHLPHGRCVLLRGFGVFYGDPQWGSVYLPRYEFRPQYLRQAKLSRLPWSKRDLPQSEKPSHNQQAACTALVADLADWVQHYETQITEQLGVDYRRETLLEWDDGTRALIPAEEIASAWLEMTRRVQSDFNALIKPMRNEADPTMAAKQRPLRRWLWMKKGPARLGANAGNRTRLGTAT